MKTLLPTISLLMTLILPGCSRKNPETATVTIRVDSAFQQIAEASGNQITADFSALATSDEVMNAVARRCLSAFPGKKTAALQEEIKQAASVESRISEVWNLRIDLDNPAVSLAVAIAWAEELDQLIGRAQIQQIAQGLLVEQKTALEKELAEIDELRQRIKREADSYSEEVPTASTMQTNRAGKPDGPVHRIRSGIGTNHPRRTTATSRHSGHPCRGNLWSPTSGIHSPRPEN